MKTARSCVLFCIGLVIIGAIIGEDHNSITTPCIAVIIFSLWRDLVLILNNQFDIK